MALLFGASAKRVPFSQEALAAPSAAAFGGASADALDGASADAFGGASVHFASTEIASGRRPKRTLFLREREEVQEMLRRSAMTLKSLSPFPAW